jgi:hypothetical protein
VSNETPLKSTGIMSPDCVVTSPITSPEILYKASQLKSLSTHEKNSLSPDIILTHDKTSPVITVPVTCSVGMTAPVSISAVHDITSETVSVVHEIISVVQLNTSVGISTGVDICSGICSVV